MGNNIRVNIHHGSTDRKSIVLWRIAELQADIEQLSIYESSAIGPTRKGFKTLISLCYGAIDKLNEE